MINKKELRKFSLLWILIFIGLILYNYLSVEVKLNLFFIYFLGALFISLLFPVLIFPLYKIWIFFSKILSFLMTRLILFLIFILVLTPIAIFMKIFNKKPINIQWKNSENSYWVKYKVSNNIDEYEKQY